MQITNFRKAVVEDISLKSLDVPASCLCKLFSLKSDKTGFYRMKEELH